MEMRFTLGVLYIATKILWICEGEVVVDLLHIRYGVSTKNGRQS
jgi:hypothetical protein